MTEGIIIAILSSGVLSTIISCIFSHFQNKKKKEDGIKAGIRMLLYDRIKTLGNKYISEKKVGSEELKDLIEMHKIYHNGLDGNGYLDALMNAVLSLPIVN